jgi:RNA polymerase sigma-70 factor (ECF subfamily)
VSDEDGAQIARAKAGDREAFGALARKHHKRVYATAFHITGNHGDADDVAQEAFLRAWRGLPGFDGRSELSTWLHRITVNVALNHLRAKRTHVWSPLDDEQPGEHDPGRDAEAKQVAQAVVTALAALSHTLRVTLILATVEDMPYKEIAQVLACPEGTVAWRVNQARKVLRAKLAALVPGAVRGDVDDVLRRTTASLGGH